MPSGFVSTSSTNLGMGKVLELAVPERVEGSKGRGVLRRHLPGLVSLINRAETGYMGPRDRAAADAAVARLERCSAGRKTG